MARLIDADALIDFIDCGHLRNPFESCFAERDVVDMLEARPTVDAVEVVRCKNCKHNGTWKCHMAYDEYYPEADIYREMHGDDDFCSYGVKEDGESNDEW